MCYTVVMDIPVAKIDYAAIAERLDRKSELRTFKYDIPHPWEELFDWNKSSFEFQYKPGPNNDQYWWPIASFPASWAELSPIVLLTRLVRNELKLPHTTACPKCNEIREMRKKARESPRQ